MEDKYQIAFSQLAYYDAEPGRTAWDIINIDDRYLFTDKWGISESELKSWIVVDIYNDVETDLQGLVLQINGNDAVVSFRGSVSSKDWTNNIFHFCTKQQQALRNIITQKPSHLDVINQYNNLYVAGHSLGGNLAVFFSVISFECGFDEKIKECWCIDGPGLSTEDLINYSKQIEAMRERITRYAYSAVGEISGLPGVETKHIKTSGIMGIRHELKSVQIDSGRFILAGIDPGTSAMGFFLTGLGLEIKTMTEIVSIFNKEEIKTIKIDTDLMKNYKWELDSIINGMNKVDERLDALSRRFSFVDVFKPGSFYRLCYGTSFSSRAKKCSDYLEKTVEEFENVERVVSQSMLSGV